MQLFGGFFCAVKSFRKAIALIAVYSLHLVFFQVLLHASPGHNLDNSFKPLFINQHESSLPQKHGHPAATYFLMLIKQGKDVGGGLERTVVPAVLRLKAVVPSLPSLLSLTFNSHQPQIAQFNLPDDAFKLYRLLGVFLI